ncbi:YdeI/OmpD-associated family protein [Undibacterium sp. TJN25]|uniref:YdeI/OmpD-associated family protein n=1 Tax=Undibacterium sp. TJN25 TaxID=3413056 RepID=UPI003BF0C3C2
MADKPELTVLPFATAAKWRQWLATHHRRTDGVWLQIFKKDAGTATVTYAEALDEALCYGWIDGQKKPFDDASWLQKFTPRRTSSTWSAINVGHAERLTGAGKMQPAGLEQVEAAKKDGRWQLAYASQSLATIPDDFLAALKNNKKAFAFFGSLNKTNLYSIAYRLHTAKKPETRTRRMQAILEMLDKGESFHPQKSPPAKAEKKLKSGCGPATAGIKKLTIPKYHID